MLRAVASVALASAILVVGGCAPAHFVEGVQYTADRSGVGSAGSLSVTHRGYVRFNQELLSDLDDVLALKDLDEMHAGGRRVLEAAHGTAVRATDSEIDRMPPAALDELVLRYRLSAAPQEPDARRAFLKRLFAERSQQRLDNDLEHVAATQTVDETRQLLRQVRRAVEPAPGDRGKLARALLAAPLFVPAAIGAEVADNEATQRAMTIDFDHVALYEPPRSAPPANAAALESADINELARWYAPVFVQQVKPDASYAAEDDDIGRVYLTGSPKSIAVHVDPNQPIVYWTHRQAKVGKRRYEQLVYVAWYPRRPAMSDKDPSAGKIDGAVVRITLDRHHRPAIYEYVRSCGCYHTLWVAEFVEAEARDEFGRPKKGEQYAVQRSGVRRELFIPALVHDDGSHPHRPIAYLSAGYHLLMGIRPLDDSPTPGAVDTRLSYRLEPYETLTHLPLGDGFGSMFGSDGLVHNAGRTEGWLLAPTGMLSAGQPRQLGTMKIRMDAYDYDDPRLLERNLRIPDAF